MKRLPFLLAVLLLAGCERPTPVNRYTLHQVRISTFVSMDNSHAGNDVETDQLVLVDGQTGQTWQYSASKTERSSHEHWDPLGHTNELFPLQYDPIPAPTP